MIPVWRARRPAQSGLAGPSPHAGDGPAVRTYGVRPAACARLLAAVLFLLCAARPASAQLASVETDQLLLVYVDGGEGFLVPHAARTFLNSLEFQKRLFDYEPDEPIAVLLADFSDTGNAGATSVPRNNLTVQIAPLSYAFETIPSNERMNAIMNHELVHIVSMDQSTRQDRFFRGLFGGKVMPVAEQPESMLYFYLTTPRVAAPRWFHEGSAVFVDTWMAGGIGRAQGGYDEMVFRAMVRDDAPFYDPLGLVSEGTKIDFQLQINSYLYGTRFLTWLARRHSPAQVVDWIARHEGSRGYYAAQFRKVFGQTLEQAWAEWIADERAFQRKNLEAIREYPITPHTDLTTRALGSVSRAWYDPSRARIYAAFNYPGVVAHVGSIDLLSGQVRRIVPIKGPVIYSVTSLAYDAREHVLFYTTDNGAHRDLVRLDPETGQTELLLKDARIGDLAFNRADRTLWGIRHLNGLCTIVQLEPPYTGWSRVVTFPYGTVVYDLDISPDGTRVVAAFGEIDGSMDVRVFEAEALRRGETTPIRRFDFGPSVPSGFVFSEDGRYLYGSAYYTGVSNIFRYEVEPGTLEAVSNTETGFFRPVPVGHDELIVFRYTGQGFLPARITATPVHDINPITFLGERLAEEKPEVKSWIAGSPARIPWDTIEKRNGVYKLAGGLTSESFYPVLQGYKDTAAAGMRWNFSDRLQLNRLALSAAYSLDGSLPASERVHLRAEYLRYDWRAEAVLNEADFYDLFGPTKTGRKGYAAGLGRKWTLVFDEPRRLELDVNGRFAGGLDRLPEYQNVVVDVDRLVTLESSLAFSDVRSSLGAVDEETGLTWRTVAQASVVEGELVPRFRAELAHGHALPLGHSSIWLRHAAGVAPEKANNPFAQFFFGGFGNNWVDRGDEKRYREYYSLPGADLNEIGGRAFAKSTAELNLPPVLFSRLGTPGFYANWLRPAVFATGLVTTGGLGPDTGRRTALSVGGQADIRFTALSTLDFTLSFGGAVALEDGRRPRRELMVSVKVFR